MSTLVKRLPGGLFPRFVALFPLLFPFSQIQGILLGISVTLPQLFLLTSAFFFLFKHESFRFREWFLPAVFVCALCGFWMWGLAFVFPLLGFIILRSVFREKPSMVSVSLKAYVLGATLLPLVVEGTSLLWFSIPAFFLCVFQCFRPAGKAEFVFFFGLGLLLAWNFFPLLSEGNVFFVTWPLEGTWFVLVPLLIAVTFMSVRALAWLVEKDTHQRFLLAFAYLIFLILAPFFWTSTTEAHVYLFWFFMAVLL